MTNQELIDALKVKHEEFYDWLQKEDKEKEEEEEEEETFSVGDIIWIHEKDRHYLLVGVNQGEIILAFLNAPGRGNTWNNIIPVENVRAITLGELSQSIEEPFGLYESIEDLPQDN